MGVPRTKRTNRALEKFSGLPRVSSEFKGFAIEGFRGSFHSGIGLGLVCSAIPAAPKAQTERDSTYTTWHIGPEATDRRQKGLQRVVVRNTRLFTK